MATRNVVLTDQQEKLITHLLDGGRYEDIDEILHEGLRLVEEREADREARTWDVIIAQRVEAAASNDGKWISEDDFWRNAEAIMASIDAEDEADLAK